MRVVFCRGAVCRRQVAAEDAVGIDRVELTAGELVLVFRRNSSRIRSQEGVETQYGRYQSFLLV